MREYEATIAHSSGQLPHGVAQPTLSPSEINSLRKEAGIIDQTIGTLEKQLLQLKSRRNSIHVKLSSLVYPVNTLPVEVLCHIFRETVSSSILSEVNATLLSITAVCQMWRSVAIADPHLWTKTCYILRAPIANYHDPLFYHFLKRTQGLPIVVYIDERGSAECSLPPALFDSCRQWTEADLSDADRDGHDFRSFRLRSPDTVLELPNLTKLTLDIDTSTQYHVYQTFSNAPRLRELAISYPNLVLNLGFPVHQLQKLTILHSTSCRQVLFLLPHLRVLEELVIESYLSNDANANQHIIEMRLLTTLHLLGADTCALLRHLSLPHLTTLGLANFDHHDAGVLIPGCLLRSSANVTSLSLTNSYYTDFEEVFRSPILRTSVRNWTVKSLKATGREMKALAALLARADFLPNLESLNLLMLSPLLLRPFLDGLRRRVANSVSRGLRHELKLRQLLVQLSGGMSAEDTRLLRELQQSLDFL
ncbi:F-box domain-containing protein [Mycena indigotica]|uniref:F-box domain-containing protein n=1 Tax=Mycena indigotica TaxID=2126181 RepID=A0A8H6SHD5_9AGAR|nr:F-box domain-containing protein [Mycena indigotica]KAF7298721.1 F-box domain-containing protein [Mycena indigotica]